MPAEDHLEGRDVDAEFAAIVAGWGLTPDLSSIEPDTDDEANADPPRAVADTAPTPESAAVAEPATEASTGEPTAPDATPGAPPDSAAKAAPAEQSAAESPTATDLPSMPGFPNIVSAVPVPAPQPAPVEREAPPAGAIEQSLDEHFVPDPVELPPQEDLHFWGIVIGLAAGPLLLLWALLFGEGHSRWWPWIGAALTLGGFALLILRQPKDRDEDDDGARV